MGAVCTDIDNYERTLISMYEKASKVLLVLLPVGAALMLQACFFGGGHPYHRYGYGYAPPPVDPPPVAYAYQPPPRVYGDYDDHHAWHDRDWWIKNNRPWVQHHHPAWLGHDHDDHDHDHH
jgi:hypothetical protein